MENIERSMNVELLEGATDATLKKSSPDRAGRVEATSAFNRQMLQGDRYDQQQGERYVRDILKGIVRGA